MTRLLRRGHDLLTNPAHTRWTAPLQLLGDAALCAAVVAWVPYTEIDWTTYMQQIRIYRAGERDYARIAGDTGPLVYPAAHVYIYRALAALTRAGRDRARAQCLFAALYLAALALVLHAYRRARAPPYLLPLLSCSRRVHSVFVLRMFNDAWAVGFLFAAVGAYQRRWWWVGTVALSVGVGVKMSLLLALPAVGVVLWQGTGRGRALGHALVMVLVQAVLAMPFVAGAITGGHTSAKNYLARAFEFSRVFQYQWTVNWRFVGEDVFLSKRFSHALLAGHVFLLSVFVATRWLRPSRWTLPQAIGALLTPPPQEAQARIASRVSPDFILTSILSAVVIGCLCARSLHYQFFVYIAWATPFLLWRSGMHPVLIYVTCAVQEFAWNVYPSTAHSSMIVVACLAVTVAAIWIGTGPAVAGDAAPRVQRDGHIRHEHVE